MRLLLPLLFAAATASAQAPRDGAHDFDFEIGRWHAHLSRLIHPLTHSTTWTTYDGTSITRAVWGGRANLSELEVDDTAGTHIEGMSLRLYDSTAHQWRIHWANARDGALGPAMVGGFLPDGHGEFYDQEDFNGKPVFVRFIFSEMKQQSFKIEQAFSPDGGKSWETNWISTFTKDTDQTTPPEGARAAARSQDFDFEEGTWAMSNGSTHIMRRVWNGRAYLGELQLKSGDFAGSLIHTYNPDTHQWALYWADRRSGRLGTPMLGSVAGGFYDQEDIHGVTALVRVVYSGVTPTSFRTDQSHSTDGGTTWQSDGAYSFTKKAP